MADTTSIEWMVAVARSRGMRAAVWNPIRGCRPKSDGCLNCWAAPVADMRGRQSNLKTKLRYEGLTTRNAAGKPIFNGTTRLVEMDLDLPLRTKPPTVFFVGSETDLWGDGVKDEWLDRTFAVEALCDQHLFIHLTKRSARMRAYFAGIPEMPAEPAARDAMIEGAAQALYHRRTGEDPSEWLAVHMPLPNVWLGVSVEDQPAADERIPDLVATPAALRWISAEPLLGLLSLPRVDFHCDLCGGTGTLARWPKGKCHHCSGRGHIPAISTDPKFGTPSTPMRHIDWIVAGGESGRGARPMHPDWARQLRDQCARAGVPFFFKQWGAWAPIIGARDGGFIGEISQFQTKEWVDGEWFDWGRPGWMDFEDSIDDEQAVERVGKKAAGRLLDGVEHNGVPGVER